MLLRQEVENLPPHLADEFCNRVPHFMSKDGREEKKSGGNVTTCCSLQYVGKRRAVHDLTVWGGGIHWTVSTVFQDAPVYFCLWNDGKFDCYRNKLTPLCSQPATPDQASVRVCIRPVFGVWLLWAGGRMERMARLWAKFAVPWPIMVRLCLKLKQDIIGGNSLMCLSAMITSFSTILNQVLSVTASCS